MEYFLSTFSNGLRLYLKSLFYISALTFVFVAPVSYAFFELGLSQVVFSAVATPIHGLLAGASSTLATTITYILLISILYIPMSLWVSSMFSTCLAVSTGRFPSFGAILRSSLVNSAPLITGRLLGQLIILVPSVIISFFVVNFPHIIPMYGKVIIPSIAYFTLYLALRYAFIEAIIVCERVGPIEAISKCNRLTDGKTLGIFILQQTYVFTFIFMNVALYLFLQELLPFEPDTVDFITTIIIGKIDSFVIVVNYWIYVSISDQKTMEQLEANSRQMFNTAKA